MRPFSQGFQIRPVSGPAPRVTDFRPDGVGRPTIDSRQAARPLLLPTVVSDGPLPTSALVREAVDTALDSLTALDAQARDVARRFRRQSLDEAQAGLADLVQSTQTLLKLAAMTAEATGTDIESLCAACELDAEARTHTTLTMLIGRQLERDWQGLAGVIDTGLIGVLAAWRLVFEILGEPAGSGGRAA